MTDAINSCVVPAVEWLARQVVFHWLLITNVTLFLFIVPPYLAPVFEAAGANLPARIIFLAYRLTCHQLPERSFFIFGHQVAICARCSALYLGFWISGLLFGLLSFLGRGRRPWPVPSLWLVGLAALPLAIDGLTQLLGLRESTNSLRAITGFLAGGSAAAFVYPLLHRGFAEAQRTFESNRLVMGGKKKT